MSDNLKPQAEPAYLVADLITVAIGEVSLARRLLTPDEEGFASLERAESALRRVRGPLQELITNSIVAAEVAEREFKRPRSRRSLPGPAFLRAHQA